MKISNEKELHFNFHHRVGFATKLYWRYVEFFENECSEPLLWRFLEIFAYMMLVHYILLSWCSLIVSIIIRRLIIFDYVRSALVDVGIILISNFTTSRFYNFMHKNAFYAWAFFLLVEIFYLLKVPFPKPKT